MGREIEIKLRIHDRKALNRALRSLKVRAADGGAPVRVLQLNTIFDTPDGGLAKHGQLLRIRTETPEKAPRRRQKGAVQRVILTFKAPAGVEAGGRHKVREEIEVEVANAGALTKILEGMGLRGWFRYEKY